MVDQTLFFLKCTIILKIRCLIERKSDVYNMILLPNLQIIIIILRKVQT